MITRTISQEQPVLPAAMNLRAEVLLLSIITIFGIIGLCYSIGLYQVTDGLSADIPDADRTELIHDREIKT